MAPDTCLSDPKYQDTMARLERLATSEPIVAQSIGLQGKSRQVLSVILNGEISPEW